ncbi:MAG: thioredoxin reductase (NADPH) [Elusimicrobia bacterium]|nr:MAG: thioredoxin reductase (NADPH) [Elusimicrobiota bacterium]KAF0154952.1 MAG: thioredoxin reductase (NADPH) [Elusimicrobiota bacterium]
MRSGETLDCVIVGGGPAGLAAGIHLARAGYRAVLLEKKSFGGQAAGLAAVENYPGFPRGVTGKKLMSAWLAQARGWGLSCRRGEAVRLSRPAGGPFSVKLKKGGSLSARSVIWCAGAAFRRLGAAGEDKFSGRGVWNTADEAPSCRGLTVVVAGGGEAAVQQAALLSRSAGRVYLVSRSGRLKAHRLLLRRLSLRTNVEWLPDRAVAALSGGARLKTVELRGRGGAAERLKADALFALPGKEPRLPPAAWRRGPRGFFTAGDARGEIFRQVAVAGGDGVRAAMRCIRYLEKI